MALINFTVDLLGKDPVALPVTVDAPQPLDVSFAEGLVVVPFTVSNPTSGDVTLENLAAVVVQGDATLVNVSMLDTVLVVQAGGSAQSSLTITPNQDVPEGTQIQVEVTGAEVPTP